MSLLISGYLSSDYGWEHVFYLFGSTTLLWLIFWLVFIQNSPSEHSRISEVTLGFKLYSLFAIIWSSGSQPFLTCGTLKPKQSTCGTLQTQKKTLREHLNPKILHFCMNFKVSKNLAEHLGPVHGTLVFCKQWLGTTALGGHIPQVGNPWFRVVKWSIKYQEVSFFFPLLSYFLCPSL